MYIRHISSIERQDSNTLFFLAFFSLEEKYAVFSSRSPPIERLRIALYLYNIEHILFQTKGNDVQFGLLVIPLFVNVTFRVPPSSDIAIFHALHELQSKVSLEYVTRIGLIIIFHYSAQRRILSNFDEPLVLLNIAEPESQEDVADLVPYSLGLGLCLNRPDFPDKVISIFQF